MKRRLCQSVGAVVKNKKGHYLIVYRMKDPKGLAFPAGHIEENEYPDQALKRVVEDAGLRIKRLMRKLCSIIPGSCSRNKRIRKHRWYIYQVFDYSGSPRTKEKKKYAFAKFMSPKKIREYIKKNDIDSAWVEIFQRLKIINGNGFHVEK